MSLLFEFFQFARELPGRLDPLRFSAEAMQRAQDVRPQPQLRHQRPQTYATRNKNTDGAVTKS